MDLNNLPPTATAVADPATGTITVNTPNPPASDDQRFSSADIERVRQEEKDKLYGRLSKADERVSAVEAELRALREEREARQQAEAQAAAQADADKSAREKEKAEAEMSAKRLLETRSQEWEDRFQDLQRERDEERAALAKEMQFAQLRAYTQERITAEADSIAPELLDLVSGETQDEIDASIQVLKAKTQAILESVQQAQTAVRSQMRGVAPTGFTSQGPLDNDSGNRQLSADDIRRMPMREYAKYRTQLLGSAADNPNRGLFD